MRQLKSINNSSGILRQPLRSNYAIAALDGLFRPEEVGIGLQSLFHDLGKFGEMFENGKYDILVMIDVLYRLKMVDGVMDIAVQI